MLIQCLNTVGCQLQQSNPPVVTASQSQSAARQTEKYKLKDNDLTMQIDSICNKATQYIVGNLRKVQ